MAISVWTVALLICATALSGKAQDYAGDEGIYASAAALPVGRRLNEQDLSATPTPTRTPSSTPTPSRAFSLTPRPSLAPLRVNTSTVRSLWQGGIVRNLWDTCAFATYFKFRWTATVDAARRDWLDLQRTAAFQRYETSRGFDLQSHYLQVLGAQSGFELSSSSLPAVCAVSNPDATIGTWVHIGSAAGANASTCSLTGESSGAACGCWICAPPALGPYSQPLFGPDVSAEARVVDLAETAYFGRWALASAMTVTAEKRYKDAFQSISAGEAFARLAGNAGVLDSVSLAGMEVRRSGSSKVQARCVEGYSWYMRGQLPGNAEEPVQKLSYFCAPSSAATRYASAPQFARVRSVPLVTRGELPLTQASFITVKDIQGKIRNSTLWWAEATNCTQCKPGATPNILCTYSADAECTDCACDIGEHLRVPCDGTAQFKGCVRCLDTAFKGDSLGNTWSAHSFIAANATSRSRARSGIQCAPGTYNFLSSADTTWSTCELDGWDRNEGTCKLCQPPRAPFAVASPPAVGKDTFTWTCTPGFESTSGNNVSRSCPASDNMLGERWVGDAIDCHCVGIGRTHTCGHNRDKDESWVAATDSGSDESWLQLHYIASPSAGWITDVASPEFRGELLAAVKFTFKVRTSNGGELSYIFQPQANEYTATTGTISFTNTAQFESSANARAGMPYEHAIVIMRARKGGNGSVRPSIGITAPADPASNVLELWAGAESALRSKMKDASGYFGLTSATDDFFLDVRMQLVTNSTGAKGLLQRHVEREVEQGILPLNGGIEAFFSKRAIATVEFAWLSRDCAAGKYQVGDRCMDCPDNSFSAQRFKAMKLGPSGTQLLNITGSAASGAICTSCQCSGCTSCGPSTAACTALNSSCTIAGKCMADGTRSSSSQCLWCNSDVSPYAFSPVPSGRPCDDFNGCTFSDVCNGEGTCSGRPSDCLASNVDPANNCEICGNNKCDPKPGFSGCISYLVSNGSSTKKCGCSIGANCYPHGALNPSNECQVCDVTANAAEWTPTAAKSCTDGNLCSYGDVCYSGQCVGTLLTCKPEGPCVKSSECDGTDQCKLSYRNSSFECSPSEGACSASAICSGKSAFCPPSLAVVPIITAASILPVEPTSAFSGAFIRAEAQAAMPFISTLAAMGSGGELNIMGYPSSSIFAVSSAGWVAPCAALEFRLGLFTGDMTTPCTAASVTDTVSGGRGWTQWLTGPVLSSQGLTVPSPVGVVLDRALIIADGTTMRARVEARSTMPGYTTVVTSRCTIFVADSTGPSAGTVRNVDLAKLVDDGLDAQFVSRRQLGVSWGGFIEDSQSSTWGGMLMYRIAVGTSAFKDNVVSWRWVGTSQSAMTHAYSDDIPVHTALFVTVQAFNRAGLSAAVSGSPVVVDDTGPVMNGTGFVMDGLEQDGLGVAVQRSAINPSDVLNHAGLAVQWGGIIEPDAAGILDHFEVAFGFSAGSQLLFPFTVVPGGSTVNAVTVPFTKWTAGSRYVATIRAVSRGGAYSDYSSPGAWYDETAPHSVRMVPVSSGYGTCGPFRLGYIYSEEESVLSHATVSVGTSAGADDLLYQKVIRGSEIASGITLPALENAVDGRAVYVAVVLTNVGFLTSSPPALTSYIQDCSPPVADGPVLDKDPNSLLGPATSFHAGPSIAASWTPCVDSTSGVAGYELRVLTTGVLASYSTTSGPELQDFGIGVVTNTSALIEALSWVSAGQSSAKDVARFLPNVTEGATYYTQVRCNNGAGAFLVRTSGGTVVDSSAPKAVVSRVIPSQSLPGFSSSRTSVSVHYVVEDAESGLKSVRIGLGAPDALSPNVVLWQAAAIFSGNFTFVNLQLLTGYTYMVSLEATNRAGLVTVVTSVVFVVDTSNPLPGTSPLKDGAGSVDLDYLVSLDSVSASWAGACGDAESGIAGYSFCAGSAAGLCDLVPAVFLSGNETSYSSRLEPSHFCTASPARLLLSDHPAPSNVISSLWTEEMDKRNPMELPVAFVDDNESFSVVSATDVASANLRQLHARELQTGVQPYGAAPDWMLRLYGVCTNWLRVGNYDFRVCIGDKIRSEQRTDCPWSLFGGYECVNSDWAKFKSIERTGTSSDGLVSVFPRMKYGDSITCSGIPRVVTVEFVCSLTAVKKPVLVSHVTNCPGANTIVATVLACNALSTYRVQPAPLSGPVAVAETYKSACFLTRLQDSQITTSWAWYSICPFGAVTSFTGTPQVRSNEVNWGYFDGWRSTPVGDAVLYQSTFYDGGSNCPGWGARKTSIRWTCAVDGQLRLMTASSSSDDSNCILDLVVAAKEACGTNLTATGLSASPFPVASSLPARFIEPTSTSIPDSKAPVAPPSFLTASRTQARVYYGPQALRPVVSAPCMSSSWNATGSIVGITAGQSVLANITVCPFNNVTMWTEGSPEKTLGWWEGWSMRKQGGLTSYDKLVYTGGILPSCADLTVLVTPVCPAGGKAGVLSVTQSGPCTIQISVAMPAICSFSTCGPFYIGRLYSRLDCINGAGLPLEHGPLVSDGVTVDPVAPTLSMVRYGELQTGVSMVTPAGAIGAVQPFYFASSALLISFSNFTTASAPLREFRVSVGSVPGATDRLGVTGVRGSAQVSLNELQLIDGWTYFPSVSAVSATGVATLLSSDIPAIYDGSPPEVCCAGVVLHEKTGNFSFLTSVAIERTTLRVCAIVREPHSTVTGISVRVGSEPGSGQFADVLLQAPELILGNRVVQEEVPVTESSPAAPSVGTPRSKDSIGPLVERTELCAYIPGLQLPAGIKLYSSLSVVNGAGLASNFSSPFEFTVAPDVPQPIQVWASSQASDRRGLPENYILPTRMSNLSFTFSPASITLGYVSAYWVAVGSLTDKPFNDDIVPWKVLFSNAAEKLAGENAKLQASTTVAWQARQRLVLNTTNSTLWGMPPVAILRMINGTVAANFTMDARAIVAVAAFNSAGPSMWLQGRLPLEAVAAVAYTPQTFIFDSSGPVFDVASESWSSLRPISVRSPNAVLPPNIDNTGFSPLEVTNARSYDVMLSWAPLVEVHSIVRDVTVYIDLNDGNSSLKARLPQVGPIPVTNPSANNSIIVRLPTLPSGRGQYTSNWTSVWRSGLDFVQNAFSRCFMYPDGLRTANRDECGATCARTSDCLAVMFSSDSVGANCFPVQAFSTISPARPTSSLSIQSWAQPTYTVYLKATNSANVSTIVRTDFVLDSSDASIPSPGLLVLAPAVCGANSLDLDLHGARALQWNPDPLTGMGAICVGFRPAATAFSVPAYAIAVGTSAGADDYVAWKRVSLATAVASFNGFPVTEAFVRTSNASKPYTVLRMFTPPFRVRRNVATVYVSLRLYSSAGVLSVVTSGAVQLVSGTQDAMIGFQVWPNSNRITSSVINGTSRSLSVSWTGPGGDIALPLWASTDSNAVVPGGLVRFEVGISTTPDEAGLLASPGWANAGTSQKTTLTLDRTSTFPGLVNPCAASRLTGSSSAGYYGWGFADSPAVRRAAGAPENGQVVSDDRACCVLCSGAATCNAWTYKQEGSKCFLYEHAVAAKETGQTTSGMIGSGILPFSARPSVFDTCGMVLLGTASNDQVGACQSNCDKSLADPVHPTGTRVSSQQECCDLCHSSPTCSLYHYMPFSVAPAANCFPLVQASPTRGLIENVTVNTGIRVGTSDWGRTFTGWWPNVFVDVQGAAITVSDEIDGWKECAASCKASAVCTAWAWRKVSSNNCWSSITRIHSLKTETTQEARMGVFFRWLDKEFSPMPVVAALPNATCSGKTVLGLEPADWPSIQVSLPLAPVYKPGAQVAFISPPGYKPDWDAIDAGACCNLCAQDLNCIASVFNPSALLAGQGNCRLYSSFERFKSANNPEVIMNLVKVTSNAPVHALVSIVSGTGVRITAASPPFALSFNLPFAGTVTHTAVYSEQEMRVTCNWAAFWDPQGVSLLYYANLWITRSTGQQGLLNTEWQTAVNSDTADIRVSSVLLEQFQAADIRCAIKACNEAGICQWVVSDQPTPVDYRPITVSDQVSILAVSAVLLHASSTPVGSLSEEVRRANVPMASFFAGRFVTVGWTPFLCDKTDVGSHTVCLGDYPGGCNLGVADGNRTIIGNGTGTASISRASVVLTRAAMSGVFVYATVSATCGSGAAGSSTSVGTFNDVTPALPPLTPVLGVYSTSLGMYVIDQPKNDVKCRWLAAYDPDQAADSAAIKATAAKFKDDETWILSHPLATRWQYEYLFLGLNVFSEHWVEKVGPVASSTGYRVNLNSVRLPMKYRVGLAYQADPAFVQVNASVNQDVGQYTFPAKVHKLAEGPVWCVVTAVNYAGLESDPVLSAVSYADWSPPSLLDRAAVFDGPDHSQDRNVTAEPYTQLSATWTGFYDAGTGVQRFEACITTFPSAAIATGKCNVANWQPTAGHSTHTFFNLSLRSNVRYYTCVVAIDGIGLMSPRLCSDGIDADASPPRINAAITADVQLELLAQASSLGLKGWKYAHLFQPGALNPDFSFVTRNISGFTSTNASSSLVSLQKAMLSAGAAGPRPRLTVGLENWGAPDRTAAVGAAMCRVSTRSTEVPLLFNNTAAFNDTRPVRRIVLANATAILTIGCIPGMQYSSALGVCLPCADGWYSPTEGVGVGGTCTECPANTYSAAAAGAAMITDQTQQTRRMSLGMPGGATTCECWDFTQVFIEAQGCVCRPGYVYNSAWDSLPPRRFSEGSLVAAVAPDRCVALSSTEAGVDSLVYKAKAGNARSLAQTCPAGSAANVERTGCMCAASSATFDSSSNACMCGPNMYMLTLSVASGMSVPSCTLCPNGTVKVGFGNNQSLCKKCPWGSISRTDGQPGCLIDVDTIGGMPDSVALLPDATAVACVPGTSAQYACVNAQHTLRVVITKAEPSSAAASQVGAATCLRVPSRLRATASGVPFINGISLVSGTEFAVQEQARSESRRVCTIFFVICLKWETKVDTYTFISVNSIDSELDASLPSGTLRVKVLGTCSATECSISCQACTSGMFQPRYLPIMNKTHSALVYGKGKGVAGTLGACSTCPGIMSGSYFAGSDRTLLADWSGVFSDNETGIVEYQFALGSVVGGAQVIPYTSVNSSVTSMRLLPQGVVTGTPMYLSVIAIDGAGNRVVLEDTRPVLVDDTSPLPGLVQDLDIDAVLGNMSVQAYLTSTGAAAGAQMTPGVVTVGTATASDPSGQQAEKLSGALTTASALMDNISDSDTAASISSRAALASVNAVPLSASASRVSAGGWRQDPAFYSLYGFPDDDFSPVTDLLQFTWEPFLDVGSGVAALGYCVGIRPFTCNVVPISRISNVKMTVDSMSLSGLRLPAGSTIYTTVWAANGVGLVSSGTTNGLVPDDRAPSAGRVYDVGSSFEDPLKRTGDVSPAANIAVDLDCDVQANGVGAAWDGFASLPGIDRYEWAAGTAPGTADLLPFRSVGMSGSARNSSMRAPVGTVVYSSVRAVGRNGKSITVSSDGVRVLGDEVDADGSDQGMLAATTGNGTYTDKWDSAFLCKIHSNASTAPGTGVDAVIVGLP